MDKISEENIDNNDDNIRENRRRRRKEEWLKKCVSNFSLYSHLVLNTFEDPYDQSINADDNKNKAEFKQKLSKSTKKRLRRQKKRKQNVLALAAKSSQLKKTNMHSVRKQTKKDLKKIIKSFKNSTELGER